jgi:hypothetical protein
MRAREGRLGENLFGSSRVDRVGTNLTRIHRRGFPLPTARAMETMLFHQPHIMSLSAVMDDVEPGLSDIPFLATYRLVLEIIFYLIQNNDNRSS